MLLGVVYPTMIIHFLIIKVNGKQIPLTEFPTDFIKNTICGMLKSLKGVDDISDVEIKFTM